MRAGGSAIGYLKARGITKEAAIHFQLGYDGERLVIPYLTPAGPWGLKRRCIAPHEECDNHPKYLNDDGGDLHLFNAGVLRHAERVVLVEGELDAIVVESTTGVPAVAVPGATAWRKNRQWRHCFDNVERIVVVADGDVPIPPKEKGVGEESAAAITADLRSAHPEIDISMVVLPLHEGRKQDSNSFILRHGVPAYIELVGL